TQGEQAGSCFWFIGSANLCVLNSKYPVLVNSPSGSSAQELLCRGESSSSRTYRHFFTEFDRIDDTIRQSRSGYIGFASALKSGLCELQRFNLSGASEAIKAMTERAEAARRSAPARLPTRERL